MMFNKESDRFEILVFHPTFNMKSSCIAAAVLVAAGHEVPPPDYMMMFNNFKTKYGKVYNGVNEDAVRFGIFKANADVIYATNARNLTFALGVNEFTDLTQEEFAASYTGLKPASLWSGLPRLSTHEYNGAPLASSVDWTTQGVVTSVKNQGQCGSCWSFQQQALSKVRGPSALAILCL